MRFFLDTANLDELKAAARYGIVDGVTTNPTLIAKEGVPLEEQVRKICDIVDGDISAEVVSTVAADMITEGRRLVVLRILQEYRGQSAPRSATASKLAPRSAAKGSASTSPCAFRPAKP